MIHFRVVPTVSVENLLLDAYRRVDEGERPGARRSSWRRSSADLHHRVLAQIKARYLKPDVCLWRNMPSVLKDPSSRTPEEAARSRARRRPRPDDLAFI